MNKIKLKEILKVTRGMSLPGKYYSTTGKYIRLTLGNFDYPNMGFKLNTAKKDIYYTGEVKSEYILKKNDIITPLTEQVKGLLGETAFIPVNDLFVQSGDIALVRPIQNKSDANYLYYLISSKIIKNQLTTSSQQTKIRHTSPKYIMNCYAFVPHLNEQKKIGSLLRKVDELILLNKQINSELEQMAKTLYNYWFVQFDFPDENGRPYKSSGGKMVWNEELKKEIPEGWEVKSLHDLVGINKVKMKPDKEKLLIDLSIMPTNSISLNILNQGDSLKSNLFKMNQFDILFGSIRPYLLKAGFAPIDGLVTGTIHSVYPINSNDYNFLLLTFCSKSLFNYAIQCSKGTRMPVISIDNLLNYKIPFSSTIVSKFNEILKFKEVIANNIIENQKLTSLRDFLLPLLMNGQAVIKE